MEWYAGVVRGNHVELDPGLHLADGLRVEVRPHGATSSSQTQPHTADDLQQAEEALKEQLRAEGRVAPRALRTETPDRQPRLHVSGEAVSDLVIRERR